VRVVRTLCCALLWATASVVCPSAHAQSAIKGPIRFLVPLPAGSTSDIVARLIADHIKDLVGQPIIVENKPGATGRIAAEALKNAAPDGSTFLMAPIAVTVLAPMVFKRLNYDPANDFAPVAQVARFQYALAVGPSHPARTVAQFMTWARAHSDQASFGTPGTGSVPHFFGVMVGRETGIAMVHVAYQGVTSLTTELIGGQVPSGISALSDLVALHRAGKIRILATSGRERSPLLPTLPTFKEQGFPTVEGVGWTGVYAPAGTAKPVIDHWSMAIASALRNPAVSDKLVQLGLEPTGTTPEEFAAIMAADTARWAPVIKTSGFTAD